MGAFYQAIDLEDRIQELDEKARKCEFKNIHAREAGCLRRDMACTAEHLAWVRRGWLTEAM